MEGYREVNYCVYIKDGDKFFKFAKHSIINNTKEDDPYDKPTESNYVWNTFFTLFPILKTIPKNDISIHKAWYSWHPLNINQKIPENKYNESLDIFLTEDYKTWSSLQNNK